MSTMFRYQLPVEQTGWKLGARMDAEFTWEYEDGRARLLNLYESAKTRQWNVSDRLDWSLQLDPENPQQFDDRMLPIYGTDIWNRMGDQDRIQVRVHSQAHGLSQFLHGEQGALMVAARLVQAAPDMDAKFYAATQVMDEARHVAFGRIALRDFYPQLTEAERSEREDFVIEACRQMRERFDQRELWQNLGLPMDELAKASLASENMKMFRQRLFSRIVPVIRDIGLWSPKVQKAFVDMEAIQFADTDIDALLEKDQKVAEEFDARMHVQQTIDAAQRVQ